MPTTIINLKVKTVEEREVPPKDNKLGNTIVSSYDITEINGDTSLWGQHSGFCVRVRRPDLWLCEAGYNLPGIPTSDPRTAQILQRREYGRDHWRDRRLQACFRGGEARREQLRADNRNSVRRVVSPLRSWRVCLKRC
jgi:hypothetical protein